MKDMLKELMDCH